MKLLRLISRLLCTMLLAVGCSTDKHTAELIATAEHLAMEYPDSTLNIISAIDPATIHGREDMAHYRLVYSEALYYNNINSDNDSITRPMVQFYMDSDNHHERARAMYQHALVKYNNGERADAIFHLLEAESSLAHVDDMRLAGLVHRTMGEIYGEENLLGKAFEEFTLAVECFEQGNMKDHAVYSRYQIGDLALRSRDYDLAMQHLNTAKEHAADTDNHYLHNYVLLDLAHLYADTQEYNKCGDMLSEVKKEYLDYDDAIIYHSLSAVVAAYNGDYDGAEEHLRECDGYSGKVTPIISFAQVKVLEFKGDYKGAFDGYCDMIRSQDELVRSSLSSPILDREIEFIKRDLEQAEEASRLRLTRSILIFGIIFAVVFMVVIWLYQRNKRYRKDIDAYISSIRELQLISNHNNLPPHSSEPVEKLYDVHITEINRLCEVYFENVNSPRQAIKIYEHVQELVNNLKRDEDRLSHLESVINSTMDNIMLKLRSHCPNITERELRIALYTCAGFSNKVICLLIGCRAETLPKIKYNIRAQIKQSGTHDLDVLLKLLYNKNVDIKRQNAAISDEVKIK